MYFNRFLPGDSVQYNGKKETLQSLLNGKEGFIVGRVGGSEREVCVTFGNDAYILDETSDLSRFVKRARPEGETHAKGPDVQKRKGVGDGSKKGGKRRPNQEEA